MTESKEFNEMTVAELVAYEGPIFYATITERYESTDRIGYSDVCSPTRKGLFKKFRLWRNKILDVSDIIEQHHTAGGFCTGTREKYKNKMNKDLTNE